MKVLKGYVGNRARPEGCIAERYLAEEYTMFCSKYAKQVFGIGTRHRRNVEFENQFLIEGRPISGGKLITLLDDMLHIAHHNILINSAEVQPYREMHLECLKSSDRQLARNDILLQKKHSVTFGAWLNDKITYEVKDNNVSTTLKWLARGPRDLAMSYSGFVVNDLRFHTKNAEKSRQNSDVSIEATTTCRGSAKDHTHAIGKVSYFGVIKDIIVLDYHTFQVPVFKCDWANIVNGVKFLDGFTLVNLHERQSQFQRDPFILALQAKQVFYSRESEASSWYVVLQAPPQGFHKQGAYEESNNVPSLIISLSRVEDYNQIEDEPCSRVDVEGKLCDT